MTRRIVVVGGTGAFGQRLVEGLLDTTDAIVVVAGRTAHDGSAMIQRLRALYGSGRVKAARFDRDSATEALRAIAPFCVVDAAGPFQGSEPNLARAAIAARCHYVDLSDARDFVAGFSAVDAKARAAGTLAVTGASSTPALSGAALNALVEGWRQVDEIMIAISPGNRAPRGLSVITAILTYAGQPIRVLIGDQWTARPGWGELVRREMPGLGRRWLSLCDTPDLDLLPARYPSAHTVLFRAGLELSLLHLGLWLLTLPVRLGLIGSLQSFAGPLRRIASWFWDYGSDRGGMSVRAVGTDEAGRPTIATWTLVAEAGDGPNIPVLPALALIRALLRGSLTATGAGVACDFLTLPVIENEFGRFRIETRRETQWPKADSLFERVLGPEIKNLPPLVRRIHTQASTRLTGRVAIEGARHPLAKWIARLFGFPGSTRDEAANVSLERQDGSEVWVRRFGRSTFRSVLHAGASPRRLFERFGPLTFELAMTAHSSGFGLAVVGWRIGPVRLPERLAPKSVAITFVDPEGRYRFDVSIALPWIGQLIHYRGWLLPHER